MIWVMNRSSKPICESSDCLLERYTMFPDIFPIFLRIPFKTYHMYIVCMITRNVKYFLVSFLMQKQSFNLRRCRSVATK